MQEEINDAITQTNSMLFDSLQPQPPPFQHHESQHNENQQIIYNPNIDAVQMIKDIQSSTKQMLNSYCDLIERLSNDKKITQEQIKAMATDLCLKYANQKNLLQSLPLYGGQLSIIQNQTNIINRHQKAVKNFKKALGDAMIWKNQMHYAINAELKNRN